MSVEIKTNNLYAGSKAVPTLDQILTNVDAVYNAFVARVAADGGTLGNTTSIRNAINFLFDNNLYGRMSVCAAPKFGYKLDGSGGITKLYSINGDDLIGAVFGSGTLPTLAVDNFINFNPVTFGTANGSILTTASKKALSKTGRMSYAIATKDHLNVTSLPITSLSSHSDFALNGDVMTLKTSTASSGTLTFNANNAAYGGTTSILNVTTVNNSKNGAFVGGVDINAKYTYLYLHGVLQGTNNPSNIPSEVMTREHYIDFGGAMRSSGNTAAGFKASALWFISDCNAEQRIAVSKFLESEYL